MQVITHPRHAVNVAGVERWISAFGGGLLAAWGIKRRSPAGLVLATLGGELVRRGVTGHCYVYEAAGMRTAPRGQGAETTSVPYELGIRVDRSVTVGKPREEVFQFWRNLENLPRFMQHLESVRVVDDKRSHWVAKAPAGRTVEWDAEIINEVPGELIGWRSLEGAGVQNAGSVHFRDAGEGRGTIVQIELQYNPPGGAIGALFARLWGEEPSVQIECDLRRFKQLMETGEIPTTEGQPSGRDQERRKDEGRRKDEVQYASEASFPASDAPAYTH
jgi:uncharacterized membrane protein